MMLVGWEDNPYNLFNASFQDDIDKWPEKKRQKFYDTCPAFDPEHSRSDIGRMGILTEYLRTYPGSIRSRHPLGYAAAGKLAEYALKDQQWQYREGSGSPLEKKGNGVQGIVGMAKCHLFNAKDLNNFAIDWMERNFR